MGEGSDVVIVILVSDFHLVGRCQLRWKEGLGSRSSWLFGGRSPMPVPEKRVHDNELTVENTSASKQGKSASPLWKPEP